jgi:hypothetical protein
VGWAGRKAEAQWKGEGKSAGKKKKNWSERLDGLKVTGKILFRKKLIFEYTKALEICTRRFKRNFDMRIFPKFS